MRRALREATVKYGAPFVILFWGVFVFGGLTLVIHVCVDVFTNHKSLVSSLNLGIVAEELAGGLFFGLVMWFTNGLFLRNAAKKNQSNKESSSR